MKNIVDYQTGGYPKPINGWDSIWYRDVLTLPRDKVLRIVETWCEDVQKKHNYRIKIEENRSEINRRDIKVLETAGAIDESSGRFINSAYRYKLLGRIFIHPNTAGAYVILLFFNWEEYGLEVAKEMGIPALPHALEIFEDLAGRLRAYDLDSDRIENQAKREYIEKQKRALEFQEKGLEEMEKNINAIQEYAERAERASAIILSKMPIPKQPEKGKVKKKVKPKGRSRLTREDIKKRKEIVKKANKMKKENPQLYWKQIAVALDIPEKTLRHYRHEYYD